MKYLIIVVAFFLSSAQAESVTYFCSSNVNVGYSTSSTNANFSVRYVVVENPAFAIVSLNGSKAVEVSKHLFGKYISFTIISLPEKIEDIRYGPHYIGTGTIDTVSMSLIYSVSSRTHNSYGGMSMLTFYGKCIIETANGG